MRITDKYVFFWRNKDIYSQWYPSNFKCLKTDITFNCAEQYMMYQKAMLFGDEIQAQKILKELKPEKHKELGRGVRNFDSDKWEAAKYEIVCNACYLKFTQNPNLLLDLLKTGDRILVEASPSDRIWGIGMGENDYGVEDEKNWKGENLLGYALTDTKKFINFFFMNHENLFSIKGIDF